MHKVDHARIETAESFSISLLLSWCKFAGSYWMVASDSFLLNMFCAGWLPVGPSRLAECCALLPFFYEAPAYTL